MGTLVLSIILVILTAVVFVGGKIAKSENPAGAGNFVAFGGLVVGLFLTVAVFAWGAYAGIENGHIGIVKQFGALQDETLDPGANWVAPWKTVDQVSVQNEKRFYKMGEQGINTGTNEPNVVSGSAVSRDSQAISLFVQVNYSLEQGKAVQLYKETGGEYLSRILDPAVLQHSKGQTALFQATQFAGNRDTIRANIEKVLTEEVEQDGIRIISVNLLDVGYSPTLAKAIEQTVEAEQQAKRAEAQVKVVTQEAAARVAEAKGLAEATLTQARADASAQRLKQRTLTPLLVQMAAIDKLNPNVSVVVCDSGKVCIPQAVIATAGAAPQK